MALYTIELRTILKNYDVFENINYKLYNNDYKKEFEEKFKNYFYYREIGFETVGRFVKELETKLNFINPYYSHLYKTMCYDYNPIENYNLNETIKENRNNTSSSTLNNTSSSTINNSETGKLTSNKNELYTEYDTPIQSTYKKYPSKINEGELEETNNSTNTSKGTSENKNNSTSSTKNNGDMVQTRNTFGNIGVQTTQDMIKKERDIILNIDKLIFEELECLFMQIW